MYRNRKLLNLLLDLEVLAQEELALSFCAVYLVLALYLVMLLQPFTDVMAELHCFILSLVNSSFPQGSLMHLINLNMNPLLSLQT